MDILLSKKVCIHCMTFNHAPFIEDAMNGFCMQETDFPFVAIIMDDCSTDGEQEVINRYIQTHFDLDDKDVVRHEDTDDYAMTYARHKENKNCYFAVFLLKYNHYQIRKNKRTYLKEIEDTAPYIAICEGDDYWTDSKKLQMQVDYLEENSEYVATSTNGLFYNTFNGDKYPISNQEEKDITLSDLLTKPRTFGTASVLYRSSAIENDYYKIKYRYDVMKWCYLANKGRFHYFNTITFTYRKGKQGITVSSDPYAWASQMAGLKKELKERFPKEYVNNVNDEINWLYLNAANKYLSKRRLCKGFFLCISKCIWRIPRATIMQCYITLRSKRNDVLF